MLVVDHNNNNRSYIHIENRPVLLAYCHGDKSPNSDFQELVVGYTHQMELCQKSLLVSIKNSKTKKSSS